MNINNKTKIDSLNGRKDSALSVGKKTERKTVCDNSNTGRYAEKVKTENSMSEADQLTIRAWKKTFKNRKKAA